MPTDVIMPQMGESIFEGTITKWLKKVGDQVQKDEPLFEISTDKVDAEIPSPVAGVLTEIKVPEGSTVTINTVVAVIGGGAGAPAAVAAPVAAAPAAVETHVSEARRGAPALMAVQLVRPMLGVRRAEVEAYLRERGQGWREDASNQDLSLTRNRVRRELMPMLRGFNPGIDELLARTAVIARDEEAFWRAEVARVLPQVLLPGKPVRGGGRAVSTAADEASCAVEIARLAAMPAALRRRVVRAAARSLFDEGEAGGRLSSEETAKVLALAGLGGDAAVTGRIGSRLELRCGLRAERSARELRFWRQGRDGNPAETL